MKTTRRRSRALRLADLPAAHAPISKVEIRNFKALECIVLGLPDAVGDGNFAPCMIILGENATGKSSALEAIALALLGTVEAAELDGLLSDNEIVPAGFLHRPDLTNWDRVASDPLSVEIGFLSSEHRTHLRGKEGESRFDGSEVSAKITLAYGPRRFFTKKKTRRLRAPVYRVRSLFDPMATIPNPADWLLACDDYVFDTVARALREILMLKRSDFFAREGGRIVIGTEFGRTPLSELSEGYKSVIAMATDIMREMLHHFDNLEFASAVVLIDEIETHLHPRWKMRIMGLLRRALPQVQFIVTTHDPLCLRGMFDGEVFVLQRSAENQRVETLVDLPSIRGMRAEQILTSEFFGLGSTDPETEAKLHLYHSLISRQDGLSKEERNNLSRLRDELQQSMAVGDTLVEQAVAEALRKAEENSRVEWKGSVRPERQQIVASVLDRLKRIQEAGE